MELYGIAVRKKKEKKKERKKERKNSISLCFDDRASVARLLQTTTTATITKRVPKRTPLKQFSAVILNMKYV